MGPLAVPRWALDMAIPLWPIGWPGVCGFHLSQGLLLPGVPHAALHAPRAVVGVVSARTYPALVCTGFTVVGSHTYPLNGRNGGLTMSAHLGSRGYLLTCEASSYGVV